MQSKKHALVILLLMTVFIVPHNAMGANEVTFTKGTDYVILNLETGLFLRSDVDNLGVAHAAQFDAFDTGNASKFLWQFTASGSGYLISNDAVSGKYLTNGNTSSTYLGKFAKDGTPWYVVKNPFNANGYLISDNSGISSTDTTTLTGCFYAYKDNSTYYLCTTSKDKVDLNEHSNVKSWYELPTFRIFTYAELYAYASKSGYSGAQASKPTADDWSALTSYITTAETLSDDKKISTEAESHNFVIADRRFRRFFAIDPKGRLHSSDRITTSNVFTAETDDSSTGGRIFYNSYHGDMVTYTLTVAHNGHSGDYMLRTSDGKYLAVDRNGNVTTSDFSTSKDIASLDREWVIAKNPYDGSDQYINIHQDDIKNVKDWYFRIENTGKRIEMRRDVTDNGGNTCGFLTDVDKAAFTQYDKKYSTTISQADIFSNTRNVRDAANVWKVTLAYAGDDDENAPIGVVHKFAHSIYYIQNINSKKYIGEPASDSQLMPLTSDKSNAALFYFLPKSKGNDNGVYSIMLLDRSASVETPKGYLDIADTENGMPNSDAMPSLKQAALIYRAATAAPTAPDAYAWCFHRATDIESRAVYSDNAGEISGYRYVTVWFPFDVINTDPDIRLYYGKWNGENSSVRFYPTNSLPAGRGGLVLAPKDDAHEMVKLYISTATDYPADISNDILTGVAEGEDYELTDESRKKIYAFSETLADGKDTTLCLGHPADYCLMANRCIVNAVEKSESVLRRGNSFTFGFGDDSTTGISEPRFSKDDALTPRYFSLDGVEVSTPGKGIYIKNGKKILVK